MPLPGGDLRISQPDDAAELPDDHEVAWAPLVPYWSVIWRSGVALAGALAATDVAGLRVVELGCGLGIPSIAAARSGATVLATDGDEEALEMTARNAEQNGADLETMRVEWARADRLVERGPFDLVVGADILYDPDSVALLLHLLPRLAPQAWIADPGRAPATEMLARLPNGAVVETRLSDPVSLYRIDLSSA